MIDLIAIVAGLIVGSFLNVCIVRIPRGESVANPPSHCRNCGEPVHWYDNLPVVSYLVLRGACRSCRARISPRYPAIEAGCAALAVALVHLGLDPRTLIIFGALTAALVVVAFVDIDYGVIPDVVTMPAILVAPAAAFIVGHVSFTDSLIGILAGGAIVWVIGYAYANALGEESLPLGSVRLEAMIGGFLGWQGALVALVVAAAGVLLTLGGLYLIRRERLDAALPVGPYLAGGALIHMFGLVPNLAGLALLTS